MTYKFNDIFSPPNAPIHPYDLDRYDKTQLKNICTLQGNCTAPHGQGHNEYTQASDKIPQA